MIENKLTVIKLVVTGPVNAGKTTLIRSLSDVPVVCTNEIASDGVSDLKEQTTVAMDHGICYPTEDLALHLYGTPGQRRFDFMWEILAEGADGIVFVVDGSDARSLEELKYIYEHYSARVKIPFLVVVTKQDIVKFVSLQGVASALGISAEQVKHVDARERGPVMELLLSRFVCGAKVFPA